MKKTLLSKTWQFILIAALTVGATIESRAQQQNGHQPPAMPEGFKVAWQACVDQGIAAPSPGEPPSTAFDACMTSQGFQRPDHQDPQAM